MQDLKHIIIRASAGSGKTYRLTERFVELIKAGALPGEILCLTFTRKAANEMKRRIRQKLLELKADNSLPDGFAPESAGELNIMTIDAFFLQILQLFSFEAGVPFGFDVATPSCRRRMITDALKRFAGHLLGDRYRTESLFRFADYAESSGVVDFILRYIVPLLDIAAQIKGLSRGYDPDRLRREFFRRRKSLIDAKRVLSEKLNEIKNELGNSSKKAERFIEEDEPLVFLDIFDKALTDNRNFRRFNHLIEQPWKMFSKAAGDFIDALLRYETAEFLRLFEEYEGYFDEITRQKAMFGFADIANLVYNLLAGEDDTVEREFLYFRLDSRIRHLLVDEFQDTSLIQWAVLEPIVNELISGKGVDDKIGSFFCVGDQKQSIYRFRGADSRLFNHVAELYKGRIQEETLPYNRRSGRNIVKFVNQVFEKIGGEYPDFRYSRSSSMAQGEGYVEAKVFADKEEIQKEIVSTIKRLVSVGKRYRDIAILVRTNSVAAELIGYLKGHDVPVVDRTSNSVAETPAGITILNALLYVADNQQIYRHKLTAYVKMDDFSWADELRGLINKVPNLLLLRRLLETTGMGSLFESQKDFHAIVETAAQFEGLDYVEFVRRLSDALSDTPSISDSLSDAVSVMTIHGSKGLEFDSVILPLFRYSIKSDLSFLEVRNDNLGLEDFVVRVKKSWKLYNREVEHIVDVEQKRSMLDELNTLYVALTRAKDALFVYGLKSGNRLSKLLFDAIGSDEYAAGELRQEQRVLEPQTSGGAVEYREFYVPQQKHKAPHTGRKATGELKKRLYGEMLHRVLERARSFTPEDLHDAFEQLKPEYRLYFRQRDFEWVEDMLKRFSNSDEVKRLFEGAVRIEREKSFLSRGELKRIDVILRNADTVKVVDYKTGLDEKMGRDDETTRQIKKEYAEQIRQYCEIARSIYGGNVEGYLVFIGEDVHVEKVV